MAVYGNRDISSLLKVSIINLLYFFMFFVSEGANPPLGSLMEAKCWLVALC